MHTVTIERNGAMFGVLLFTIYLTNSKNMKQKLI